jgi:hypothetical protein
MAKTYKKNHIKSVGNRKSKKNHQNAGGRRKNKTVNCNCDVWERSYKNKENEHKELLKIHEELKAEHKKYTTKKQQIYTIISENKSIYFRKMGDSVVLDLSNLFKLPRTVDNNNPLIYLLQILGFDNISDRIIQYSTDRNSIGQVYTAQVSDSLYTFFEQSQPPQPPQPPQSESHSNGNGEVEHTGEDGGYIKVVPGEENVLGDT